MDPDELLADLDDEQRTAVTAVRGPVCVLAGAGSGKTRVVTRRIAYAVRGGVVAPSQVLAVTFSVRAAREMQQRLQALQAGPVQARTFHSAALRQLRYFWPRVVGGPQPTVIESKLRTLAQVAAPLRRDATVELLRDAASEIEWAKATLVTPEDYPRAAAAAGRQTALDPRRLTEIYTAYEQAKQRLGQVDFEDLLLLVTAALDEHRDVAREVRDRYRYFVVDEYQDVNPLQQRLLDAWLGGRSDVCVVGDPDQTIYSFTGASAAYLEEFPRRHRDATVVRLTRDYRSGPQVVAIANQVLSHRPASAALRAAGPDGPPARITGFADEAAEAAAVAARCAQLVRQGTPASDIAVLFRMNAQSELYEHALATVRLPYRVQGGVPFFARPEVRQAVLTLRTVVAGTGADEPALLAVRSALGELGWSSTPPAGVGAAFERWQSLQTLLTLAEEAGESTLAQFVRELGERSAEEEDVASGVTLGTLHAAKGLEWDVVFLVGLCDGTVPSSRATTPEQAAEERRLLYVGVTRARRELWLSWGAARAGRPRRRSRFLDDIPAAGPRRGRQRTGRPRPAATPTGGPEHPADPQLVAVLRSWRTATARERGRPAFTVLTDATLLAVAAARPASTAELAAVPGIGPGKLAVHGEELLRLVRATDGGPEDVRRDTAGAGKSNALPPG